MTAIQKYAIRTAKEKTLSANAEFQSLLVAAANELGIDCVNETWSLSDDMKFLERQGAPDNSKEDEKK